MTDFSFVDITDRHLLESDFILSTGDLVEPDRNAACQGALHSSTHIDATRQKRAGHEIITPPQDSHPMLISAPGALGDA